MAEILEVLEPRGVLGENLHLALDPYGARWLDRRSPGLLEGYADHAYGPVGELHGHFIDSF